MRDDWEYRRGDVYLADLNPVVGAEIGGVRPVLVLQNDVGNHFGPTLIVAPMTSNIEKKPAQPTHFLLKRVRGLSKPSMVILEQLKTLDKAESSDTWEKLTAGFLRVRRFANALP